jgi:fructokinase
MNVVVIGDALVDEMRDASGSVDAPGGSALNVAVGLAVLGVPSTLVAMFGEDADGQLLARHLADHGVTSIASPAPLGTGRAVSDRTDGEPRYSFTAAQVQRHIDFDVVGEVLAAADVVAVSGFPFDNAEQVEQLRTAAAGKRLLIDPNPRPGLLVDRVEFVRGLEQLAAGAALVKVGDDDAQLLWGEPLPVVAQRLVDAGADAVLATAGERGASIYFRDGETHHPIVAGSTPIVDTMGAGDATFAAVIAHSLSARGWSEALPTAMAIAAETIRHPGGLLRVPATST